MVSSHHSCQLYGGEYCITQTGIMPNLAFTGWVSGADPLAVFSQAHQQSSVPTLNFCSDKCELLCCLGRNKMGAQPSRRSVTNRVLILLASLVVSWLLLAKNGVTFWFSTNPSHSIDSSLSYNRLQRMLI